MTSTFRVAGVTAAAASAGKSLTQIILSPAVTNGQSFLRAAGTFRR